jgi:hypothetical protein
MAETASRDDCRPRLRDYDVAAMRLLSRFVLMFCWALWFGGLIALMLGVMSIFKEFTPDRLTAGRATAAFFRAWGLYELAVAAGALVGAVAVRLLMPSRAGTIVFVLLALSAVLAVVTTGVMMPQLETLRVAGEQQSPLFRTLHGRANALFLGRTVILFATGLVLPTACQAVARREALKSASS